MAKQLTIFVENRPGRIQSVAQILEEAGLNVWAFTIQDRGQFGLMKVILDNPEKGKLALEDTGHACALKEVIAIQAPDKPGNLNKLTKVLLDQNVNISDAYGFTPPDTNERSGICFLELKDAAEGALENALEKLGFTILTDEELYDL